MSALGKIALAGTIMAAFFAAYSVGASSLTDRKAIAAIIIFAVPQAVSIAVGIVVGALDAPQWLLGVVHMIPSRDRTAADWESTWASLTFARERARRRVSGKSRAGHTGGRAE